MVKKQVEAHIQAEHLFQPGDKIILATSGGIDSMCMLDILQQFDIQILVAHCNYQLREKDADLDEELVRNTCKKLDVECEIIRFDTIHAQEKRGGSIQETARKLRYDWLEELRKSKDYDWIATAHHKNDAVETLLFNLGRGCGLKGLHGILPKLNRIIRPLLPLHKTAIQEYAHQHNVIYREDTTNFTKKYTRNRIRQEVIPAFEAIFPKFIDTTFESIRHFRAAESIYSVAIRDIQQAITIERAPNYFILSLEKLNDYPAPNTVLYELLDAYGFSPGHCAQMLEANSGAQFSGDQFRVIVDRETIVVERIMSIPEKLLIRKDCSRVVYDRFQIKINVQNSMPPKFNADPNIALIDIDKLEFPLTLRVWEPGDKFQPIGMSGKHQKVKDYLTDRKVPLHEKDRTRVLVNRTEICWLVGHRLDERYKIDPDQTKNILSLQLVRF